MGKLISILSKVISEAKRIKLDLETVSHLENFTNKIYKKKLGGVKGYTVIGNMPITTSDGVRGNVEIVMDPNLPYLGLLDQKIEDSKDPNDFILSINPTRITSKKYLYQTLYHEIMHATDPVFSTKQSEKVWSTYDPEMEEKYWSHPIEFRASANEFLEGLVREFNLRKSRLKKKENILFLEKAANSILSYFANGKKLNKLAYDIISQITDEEILSNPTAKVLRNITVDFPNLAELMPERKGIPKYITIIEYIKEYDKEIWKKFLTMLYNTIDEIKKSMRN